MAPLHVPLLAGTALLLALAAPTAARAATLDLDAAGKLLGARGVVVNGTAYDVQFLDGSCAALHNGCDAAGDFVFHTNAESRAASLALQDQVFNAFASIDANPTLTRGCEDSTVFFQGAIQASCWLSTAYQVMPQIGSPELQVATTIVAHTSLDAQDIVSNPDTALVFTQFTDLSDNRYRRNAFAVWSAAGEPPAAGVPEPGSLALAALGLLAALKRPRRR